MTSAKRTRINLPPRPRTSSNSRPRVISSLTLIGAGAEYKIESKMTLTQASLENTKNIMRQKELEKGSSSHSNRLLDADKTRESGVVNPGVADIIFEGTFKPQTMHLNQPANYSGNVDEGGMPFGTFGGGYRLEEGSGAAYPARDQTSFYNASSDKQREISIKTLQ